MRLCNLRDAPSQIPRLQCRIVGLGAEYIRGQTTPLQFPKSASLTLSRFISPPEKMNTTVFPAQGSSEP